MMCCLLSTGLAHLPTVAPQSTASSERLWASPSISLKLFKFLSGRAVNDVFVAVDLAYTENQYLRKQYLSMEQVPFSEWIWRSELPNRESLRSHTLAFLVH